jgi:hypothetical protein
VVPSASDGHRFPPGVGAGLLGRRLPDRLCSHVLTAHTHVVQVTAPCEDGASVVARSGCLSTFAALEKCCPSSIRDSRSAKGRSGLTMIEYNKTLEKAGFQKARDRRSDSCPVLVLPLL